MPRFTKCVVLLTIALAALLLSAQLTSALHVSGGSKNTNPNDNHNRDNLGSAASGSILHEAFVKAVNAKAKGQWEAALDNGAKVRGLTRAEARTLMGVTSISNSEAPARVFTAAELAEDIPKSFDSATRWPGCPTIREIRDQSNCGSCWAIAAAESISDRYCTLTNTTVRISTRNLLSCCFVCGFGCQGGVPTAAWMWWVWVGLSTEECQPYPFAPCGHHTNSSQYPACPATVYDTPSCNLTCDDKSNMVRYNGQKSYGVTGEEAYQRELMRNGPFEVAFTVYEDFVGYKKGVYQHVSGSQLGGHAVRLVGWGEENGVKYWKIANSWNEDWGDHGYFKILRGTDECGIESSGVAGTPAPIE